MGDSEKLSDLTDLARYRAWTEDLLRYNDVDAQGHVNNTVFPVFFETGRLAINRALDCPSLPSGIAVVVAKVTVDYLRSLRWPGSVQIGTRVLSLGRSSVTFGQGLFDSGHCAATCTATIVLRDMTANRSYPLPADRRAYLEKFL